MGGYNPYVLQALIEGVLAAKNEIQSRGLPIKIGFGSALTQFGIMRDNYSPKPAFSTFKSLIDELGL